MGGIPTVSELRAQQWQSLYLYGLGYRRRGNELQYDGARPGPGWVAHGYFPRWLWVLGSGGPRRVRLWKHRWRDKASGRSTHSRPPDELGRLSVCSLTFALLVFGWLSGVGGAARHESAAVGLEQAGSRRTLQRWMPATAEPSVPSTWKVTRSSPLALVAHVLVIAPNAPLSSSIKVAFESSVSTE